MMMDNTFYKNHKLPTKGDCEIYKSLSTDKIYEVIVYELFSGVHISFKKVRCEFLPEFSQKEFENNILVINYCIKGQCEMFLKNEMYVHQKSKDFSMTTETLKNGHSFPKKYYDGIEFFIDIREFNKNNALLIDMFNIDFDNVFKKIQDEKFFISHLPHNLESIILQLWDIPKCSDQIVELRLYAIHFLHSLVFSSFPKVKYAYLTPTQNDIAKKTYKIITTDLSKSYSARELAEKFKISETSLKTYFKIAYGKNISLFLKDLRLDTALDMLLQTKLSISEISNIVGYTSQSKFAAIFKKRFALTPLEFRKQKIIESLNDS